MRVIIDTDPAMGSVGGDPEDCFAIMLALNSPELQVEGITVVQGNVPVDHGYANAVHWLELLGRSEVPVMAGLELPMSPVRTRQRRWLEQRGKLERLVPRRQPAAGDPHAVDYLIETVLENPGEITLITIGPLTNVALAHLREREFARRLGGVVMMGGNAAVPGNITPMAEFNIWSDPDAASIFFEAGVPITMVGLDVCEKTHLEESTVQVLSENPTELSRFVAQAVTPWIEFLAAANGSADFHLYDSLAVAVAAKPDLVTTREAFVAVETEGRHCEGATVTYLDPTLRKLVAKRDVNAQVALEVRAKEFEELFESRVIKPML
jgi:inosine-uridine nucleoside N-ribohydrolase